MAKKKVTETKPAKEERICKDCQSPTKNFYPIPKSNNVRCSDCQERYIRHAHRDDGMRGNGNYSY